jgi:hypothetical protein
MREEVLYPLADHFRAQYFPNSTLLNEPFRSFMERKLPLLLEFHQADTDNIYCVNPPRSRTAFHFWQDFYNEFVPDSIWRQHNHRTTVTCVCREMRGMAKLYHTLIGMYTAKHNLNLLPDELKEMTMEYIHNPDEPDTGRETA